MQFFIYYLKAFTTLYECVWISKLAYLLTPSSSFSQASVMFSFPFFCSATNRYSNTTTERHMQTLIKCTYIGIYLCTFT